MTALDELLEARQAIAGDLLQRALRRPPEPATLPDAFLHDREHLAWLELVTKATGRRPFYESPDRARLFGGIPIFLDATVPANVLEHRGPAGRGERIDLSAKVPRCPAT